MRYNDNSFVFNRILGYNTVFYDLDIRHWYWDEVNSQIATYYFYIQPLRPHTVSLDPINDKWLIIPIAKVFPTAEVLEGVIKHIIPLYTHVMFKVKIIVTIHPTYN